MLNRINLMGRLTKDPELRATNSNKPVATFTLAVDRDFGEKATDFINVVAWNQTANFVKNYFGKGQMMTVSGRLQSRKWEDRDGNKRTEWEVVADAVYFCGDKSRAEKADKPVFEELSDDDGDLPF